MNNLSWFIYLTQIVDNFATFCRIMLGVGGIAVVFSPLLMIAMDEFGISSASAKKGFAWYIVGMVFLAIGAVVTPSRQTMIMIAGSEMGERLAKSDGVQSIVNPGMDLIRKWIKQEADKIKDKG